MPKEAEVGENAYKLFAKMLKLQLRRELLGNKISLDMVEHLINDPES